MRLRWLLCCRVGCLYVRSACLYVREPCLVTGTAVVVIFLLAMQRYTVMTIVAERRAGALTLRREAVDCRAE